MLYHERLCTRCGRLFFMTGRHAKTCSSSCQQKPRIDHTRRGSDLTAQERDDLVASFVPMVLKIASKVADIRNCRQDLHDLFQHGIIGLLSAIRLFDPDKNVKFITYAYTCVWRYITRAIDVETLISTPAHLTYAAYRGIENKNSDDEFDRRLRAVVNAMRIETIPAEFDFAEPRRPIHEPDRFEPLHRSLDKLPERARKLLTARFGLDGKGGHTLEEVGKMFGISKERARQIQNKALRSIRKCLDKRHFDKDRAREQFDLLFEPSDEGGYNLAEVVDHRWKENKSTRPLTCVEDRVQ